MLHDKSDRNCNEQEHQIVEKSAGGIIFAPPVVRFGGAYEHRGWGARRLDSNIHLRSLAPKCLQIVNTCHLVPPIIRTLQSNFAESGSDENCELGSAFMDRLFG